MRTNEKETEERTNGNNVGLVGLGVRNLHYNQFSSDNKVVVNRLILPDLYTSVDYVMFSVMHVRTPCLFQRSADIQIAGSPYVLESNRSDTNVNSFICSTKSQTRITLCCYSDRLRKKI